MSDCVLVRYFGSSDRKEEKLQQQKVMDTILGKNCSSVSEGRVLIAHVYAAAKRFVYSVIL